MLTTFALYAPVVALACAVVMLGVAGLGRLSGRQALLLGTAWVAGHLVLGVSAWREPAALSTLIVVGSACFGAVLLARAARSRGALVALAVTASIVDIASFSGGVTRWLLTSESESESGSRALRYLTVTLPTEEGLVAVVGIADLAFLGAFFLGLQRFGLRRSIAASALVGALLVALVVGLALGGAFGIPFMAVAVIAGARPRAADASTRRFGPSESGPRSPSRRCRSRSS